MSRLLKSMSTLFLLGCSVVLSANPRRWAVHIPDPYIKASVCYPTDLLHVRFSKEYEHVSDLRGADGATVLLGARPDKSISLKDQLRYSLDQLKGGPVYLHESGPGLTPVHYANIPRKWVVRKIVKPRWYLYVAEDKTEVEEGFGVHVDRAIKELTIIYPKSHGKAWKNVPERMRSCLKSFGEIDPMLR